jgi:hypothetical protein
MLRLMLATVLVFMFMAWDMSRNHGQYTRSINNSLRDLVREAQLR